MIDPSGSDGACPSVKYPPFEIQVPADAGADDLVAAANCAHELVVKAHGIVFWLDWIARPLGLSLCGTPEELLGDLPEEVDRRIFECERRVKPLRLELHYPANCYSEGTFHAPCAHDAALRYATEVRTQLDLIARVATGNIRGGIGELLPGSALRGQWEKIVGIYRDRWPGRFEGLPSHQALLSRLTAEATYTIRQRMKEGTKGPSNGRQKPGTPADPTRAQIAARVRALKPRMKWPALVKPINKEFPRPGNPWTVGALRGLIRTRR